MAQVAIQLNDAIAQCATMLCHSLRSGGKVLIMGNGGSAADAQHFAAELVGRFLKNRPALPAIALTTDTSILTAIGNDFGFSRIFSRQLEALVAPEDVVIGISTSGQSENILQGLLYAQERGCRTLGFLGNDGGKIGTLVDLALIVPEQHTPFIQEAHLTIIHILCDLVEEDMFFA